MELKNRYGIGIRLLLCVLSGFASCAGGESFAPPRGEAEESGIYLTFHTAVAGASARADGEDEAIRQLRVVIVSKPNGTEGTGGTGEAQWVVEHNEASPGTHRRLKVKPGCSKRIYLLANCDGLKGTDGSALDFGDEVFIPNENGTAEVDNLVFGVGGTTGTYSPESDGIPMTAMYEIDIPEREEIAGGSFEIRDPLLVVRAATKFSFSFTNHSTDRKIAVTGFGLDKIITNRMYLMPHVNKNGNGKYWVVTGPKESLQEKTLEGKNNQPYTNKVWIDWMNDEAKKSNRGGQENAEWLTDYAVPEGASHDFHEMTFSPSVVVPPKTGEGDPTSVESPAAFYLPESRNLKTGEEGGSEWKLQEYELTIHTEETFTGTGGGAADGDKIEREYTATLSNLLSLFRNTHVKVNVAFYDYNIDCTVNVVPYEGVELEPEFGLGEPTPTTP